MKIKIKNNHRPKCSKSGSPEESLMGAQKNMRKSEIFNETSPLELKQSIDDFLRKNQNIRIISSSMEIKTTKSTIHLTKGVIGTFEGPIVTNYSALIIYEEGE